MARDSYNGMGMVSPKGEFFSTEDQSHPDWCHEHRDLVGFVGVKDLDGNPVRGEDAYYDKNNNCALDLFLFEGWIRVKPDQGIELGGIDEGNIRLVKNILTDIAEDNPGKGIYVDTGDETRRVSMIDGEMDFSEIEPQRRGFHRY
jgi:hypothetical protein